MSPYRWKGTTIYWSTFGLVKAPTVVISVQICQGVHAIQGQYRGYMKYYVEFFEQWHYRMKIQERCKDPTVSQTYGITLESASNTYYPAGTICANDFAAQSCFSTGDSGSPLMATEEDRPVRYYVEGILSFVRGCDTHTFGNRND